MTLGFHEDKALDRLVPLPDLSISEPSALAQAQNRVVECKRSLHLWLKERLAQACPEEAVLSFSGKGHVRGAHSTALEIGSWHLLSTWIPCQAPCMCGCSRTPTHCSRRLHSLQVAWQSQPDFRMRSPFPSLRPLF